MPSYVITEKCDGCKGQDKTACMYICPHDLMKLDKDGSETGHAMKAFNQEPEQCWECYSCVKACPQHAIDCRGYSDFAPMGHSVRGLREEEKGTVSWKIKFRDGREKNFVSPIRTTPWGSIKPPFEYAAPDAAALNSPLLAHEPEMLKVDTLPTLRTAAEPA